MKINTKTPRFDFVLDNVLKEMAIDPSTGITTFAATPSTSATNPLQSQSQVGQPTTEQQPQAGQQPGQVGQPVIPSQDDPFANINIDDPTVFAKLKLKLGTGDPAKFSELLKRLMN